MATALEKELFNITCNHLNGNMGVTQKIKRAMEETAKQFVYIGFLLWEVREYQYYYENGYGSVYEYAETELGFKRSSTKNFIAICEQFCRKSDHKLPTMFLDERWNDFSYSQLTEMLSMSAAKREQVAPSMTVKQLRELKREPEEPKQVPKVEQASDAIGQTSGQKPLAEVACTVNNLWKDLDKADVKELCFLTGKKFNTHSNYRIEIKPIAKDVNRMMLKRRLCEAAGIKWDPTNYDYGITVELMEK